jgi:ATP-dependent Clp protease ATP-binding subunit ClpA
MGTEIILADHLEKSVTAATGSAGKMKHEYVTPEHLLRQLLMDPGAASALDGTDGNLSAIRDQVTDYIRTEFKTTSNQYPTQSDDLVKLFYRAEELTGDNGPVSSIAVLIAMMEQEDSFAARCLKDNGADKDRLTKYYLQPALSVQSQPLIWESNKEDGGKQPEDSALKRFAVNLNEQAMQDKIDPVIGREREIQSVMETLVQRRSPNVALVGEAGVGKTAIAEGLAARIVEGDVPERLKKALFMR